MPIVIVYPWNEKSKGAKEISSALGVNRILLKNSKFTGSPDKTVINWGASDYPLAVIHCKIINTRSEVSDACDKLVFFNKMAANNGGRIPPFTTSKDVVIDWLKAKHVIVARKKLRARSGAGIAFFEQLSEFTAAPLYTQYIRKKEEYRVHFAFGKVIDVQKKVLRKHDDAGNEIDPKQVDWRVRNAENGFIFIRHDISVPEDVSVQALKCAEASGLHFGAADVIWNETAGKAYVLEINTAPGIEGTTITNYANAFKKELF